MPSVAVSWKQRTGTRIVEVVQVWFPCLPERRECDFDGSKKSVQRQRGGCNFWARYRDTVGPFWRSVSFTILFCEKNTVSSISLILWPENLKLNVYPLLFLLFVRDARVMLSGMASMHACLLDREFFATLSRDGTPFLPRESFVDQFLLSRLQWCQARSVVREALKNVSCEHD
jgi:hypothetical protein